VRQQPGQRYFYQLWTPEPFFMDSDFSMKLDKDYMDSVTVKSTAPMVVEYKWRPEAVWSDGAPVGCKDMYLLYLAAKGPGTPPGGASPFDSAPTGYNQISKDGLLAGRKTVTVTFGATPYADYRGMWSAAGEAGSQILPGTSWSSAPASRTSPRCRWTGTPRRRTGGHFFTHGWNDVNTAVDLSAGRTSWRAPPATSALCCCATPSGGATRADPRRSPLRL